MSDWTFEDVESLSGTAETIATGLSGVVTVRVMFKDFSTNAANQALLLQLGTGGGFVTSGYLCECIATGTAQTITTGFLNVPNTISDAADLHTGIFELILFGSNKWMCRGTSYENGIAAPRNVAGYISLGGALTQLRLTTTGGSATFDSGQARAAWK